MKDNGTFSKTRVRATYKWSCRHSPSCVRKFPVIVPRRQALGNHTAGNEWFHINGHLPRRPQYHKVSYNDAFPAQHLPFLGKIWFFLEKKMVPRGFSFPLEEIFFHIYENCTSNKRCLTLGIRLIFSVHYCSW